MDYDKDKVDEMVLALLFLTLHGDGRAWKGHDWDAMGRLYEKGMICDRWERLSRCCLPKKAKSAARNSFKSIFALQEQADV